MGNIQVLFFSDWTTFSSFPCSVLNWTISLSDLLLRFAVRFPDRPFHQMFQTTAERLHNCFNLWFFVFYQSDTNIRSVLSLRATAITYLSLLIQLLWTCQSGLISFPLSGENQSIQFCDYLIVTLLFLSLTQYQVFNWLFQSFYDLFVRLTNSHNRRDDRFHFWQLLSDHSATLEELPSLHFWSEADVSPESLLLTTSDFARDRRCDSTWSCPWTHSTWTSSLFWWHLCRCSRARPVHTLLVHQLLWLTLDFEWSFDFL
jgi:hypothetical protein